MEELNRSLRGVRFGVFEVDLRSGELHKQGLKIKLQGQPIQILSVLLERPGELVTREELREKLWPADTFVDFEHGLNAAIKKLRAALGDSADNPRFVETLHRRGYRFIASVKGLGAPVGGVGPAPIESLAVLPLENLSGDPEQEYFADGMTEALIGDLGKIGALRVISRTSVMQYKKVRKPLPEIARELNVDAVVEGSVLRADDRVRITAQLIRAVPEQHLWAQSYERDLRDILVLQREVARAIAREIKIALTPEEQTRLASARPVNPEAYETCLKGRFYWYKLTPQDLETALQYFELALEKDPNYALAYIGIADVWGARAFFGVVPPREAFPKDNAAGLRALELDDTLAEGHYGLGSIRSFYEWDWAAGEAEYQRAIELNPNFARVRIFYGHFLSSMRRPQEGMAQFERGLELDPLNSAFQAFSGWNLLYLRRAAISGDEDHGPQDRIRLSALCHCQ